MKPTHCICGTKLVPGEVEYETKAGIKILVPAMVCLDDDCEMSYYIEQEVMDRADELAMAGVKKYITKSGVLN